MPKIIKDDDIYQAVINVIIQRGYNGATTKEIAQAAGVSEMTLFRKYESKAQLVLQAFTNLQKRIDIQAAVQYSGDVVADLSRVVDLYIGLANRYGSFIVILLSEFPRHPELAGLIDKPWAMAKAVESLIERYQESGVLRVEPPMRAVIDLIGPIIYAVMLQEAVPTLVLPPLTAHNDVARFLEGHRAIPRPS